MKRKTVFRHRPRPLESWPTVYIDFMTNIMIFFVILWSLNQGKTTGVSDTVGNVTERLINLPGDVLFAAGKTELTDTGKGVIEKLFKDDSGSVLNFATNGLVRRMLVVHGHTDGDGNKEQNIRYGFERAQAAFQEIKKYSPDLADHVVICTHADNSPAEGVPDFTGDLTPTQKDALRNAKEKNRRITIEDKLFNQFDAK